MAKRLHTRSAASRALGDGVTYNVPTSSVALISSTTAWFRWPTSIAPNPIDRSSNWRPSTSVIQAPLADLIEIGYGSQCWKLEGTPNGSECAATLFSIPEAVVLSLNLAHSWSSRADILDWDNGVEWSGVDLNVCEWFAWVFIFKYGQCPGGPETD